MNIRVGLLGFGTVGTGTYELLNANKDIIGKRIGAQIDITKIFVRNIAKYEHKVEDKNIFTTNVDEIIKNDEIDIVVEVMGGTTFSYECIKSALQNGKNVVTANKDLIATKGVELFNLAAENKVDFRYEASVLGGIPIIRVLYDSLGCNKITEMLGIMNGTTNFILTKMTEENQDYADVLKEAQRLGYAEADPTADVEGYDAARKLAILSSIAFNEPFVFEDVDVQGITSISKNDIKQARDMGYLIKLIGRAKTEGEQHSLAVYPMLVKKEHPLSAVRGAYNAIYVKGDGIGESMLYGQGAGSMPTGSSVLSDIMEISSNILRNSVGRNIQYYKNTKNIFDSGLVMSSYYMRMCVENKTGVLAQIANTFACNEISVRTVNQYIENDETASLIVVTEPTKRSNLLNAVNDLSAMEVVHAVKNYLAVLE